MPGGIGKLVEQRERMLAAPDHESVRVVLACSVTEEAAVLLVRRLDVLEPPRCPYLLRHSVKSEISAYSALRFPHQRIRMRGAHGPHLPPSLPGGRSSPNAHPAAVAQLRLSRLVFRGRKRARLQDPEASPHLFPRQ